MTKVKNKGVSDSGQSDHPVFGSAPDVSDEDRSQMNKGSEIDPKTDTSEHKDYTVLVDGANINGELCNIGDIVTMHPDDARRHTDADVRLSEVKEEKQAA
jgi:hypothetical protein